MSIRARILRSQIYNEGAEFTVSRAVSQLSGHNKPAVRKALSDMNDSGEVSKRVTQEGSHRTAYYRKSTPAKAFLSMPLLHTPSTPEFDREWH